MDIEKLAWLGIVERLERGERVTKAEVARRMRLNPPPPPEVMELLATVLEGESGDKGGRPKKGAFDKLLVGRNRIKGAAQQVRFRRQEREDNGEPTYGTLTEDIEQASLDYGVRPSQVRKEYTRFRK